MDEKVKIVVELDKTIVQSAGYIGDIQLTDELWDKMVAEPVSFPMEGFGKTRKKVEIAMAMVAMGHVLKKMENKQ